MTYIVAAIGAIIALLGVTGVFSPAAMKAIATRFRSPAGMYAAVVIRLVMGVLLYWAGPYCRPETPWIGWVVRLVGVLVVVAAVVLLLLGPVRFRATIDWFLGRSPTFQRCWAAMATVFGAFLIYAGT